MKKIIIASLLVMTSSAFAGGTDIGNSDGTVKACQPKALQAAVKYAAVIMERTNPKGAPAFYDDKLSIFQDPEVASKSVYAFYVIDEKSQVDYVSVQMRPSENCQITSIWSDK